MKRKSLLMYVSIMLYICLITILFCNISEVSAAQKVNVRKISVAAPSGSKRQVVVAKGKKVKLTANVNVVPDKRKNKNVTYQSKNSKIALVNKAGVIRGVKAGRTKIVVTSKKNQKKKVTINVKVVKNAIKSIILNKKKANLLEGEKTKLTVSKYLPTKKIYKYVKWSSNNQTVATVNNKGEVIAHKEGMAIIKAIAVDGSQKTANCKIIVNKKTDAGNEKENVKNSEGVTQNIGNIANTESVTQITENTVSTETAPQTTENTIETGEETKQITNLLSAEYNNELAEIKVIFDSEIRLTKDEISINCVYEGEEQTGLVDFPINSIYTEDNKTYHLYLANGNVGKLIDDMKLNIHISSINGMNNKEVSTLNNQPSVGEDEEEKALEHVNIKLFTKDQQNLSSEFKIELFAYESGKKIASDNIVEKEGGAFACNIPYGKYIVKVINNEKIYNHQIVTIENRDTNIDTDFVNVSFSEDTYHSYEDYYDQFNNSQDIFEYYLPGTYTVLKKAINEVGEVTIAKYSFTVKSVAVICTPVYEEYVYEEKGALLADTIVENEFKSVFVESGDGIYFKFIAPKNGIYTFLGIGCINTLGRIYDANNNLLAENLNDGIGENFSVSYEMESGKTYYIEARVEENNLTAAFVIVCK